MLLKLQMPYIDRMVEGAIVVKWHKREGDFVNYGDDLVDLNIQASSRPIMTRNMREFRQLEARDPAMKEMDPLAEPMRGEYLMRVLSSDVGTLYKIYAQEGACRRIGEILAILTSDQSDATNGNCLPDEDSQEVAQASVFRVIANMLQPS